MLLALLGAAFAADVLVLAPDGPLAVGEPGVIEVVVSQGGRGVTGAPPTISAAGAPLPLTGETAPGRYRYLYTPRGGGSFVDLVVQPVEGPAVREALPISEAVPPAFSTPPDVEAAVGTPRIEVRFPRTQEDAVDPPALLARTSEGRVLEVRAADDAVVVVVEPGGERVARVMAVALVDRDEPRGGVAFGLIRLRARPQLSIQAEPRSTVNVKVGKRSYGPFVADASGAAQVSFDALPGESSYEVTVADDLGNTQRSTGPLPAASRPVLVGVEVASPSGADVWLGAWSPAGAPWTGAAPFCRSGAGEVVPTLAIGRNTWRVPVPRPAGGSVFDPRLDVSLGEATLSVRVPFGADLPSRVELQAYPTELSADFPIAQVQAALLDARGERMDVTGLELRAARGELTVERTGEALRADYLGRAAVEAGGDVLTASWEQPPGSGHPWTVEAWPTAEAGELVVLARARDRLGRPVAGVPVIVTLGVLDAEARTDARGWARVRFPAAPAAPTILKLRADTLLRELAWLPGETLTLPDPAAPDISAQLALPIRVGTVRQVFLDVSPRPFYLGAGTNGVVTVRLLDAAGQPVRDEVVSVTATEGVVGTPEQLPDGSFRAQYTPPAGMAERTVRFTAAAQGASVATDLQLEPRPVTGGVAVAGGWIGNFRTVNSPQLSVYAWQRLPIGPKILAARVGVTVYGLEESVQDSQAESSIDVQATFVPVDLGLMVLERWGARSLHFGLATVVTPYAMNATFGRKTGVNGLALANPGLVVQGGAGYRLGGSELFVEARYLLYTAGSGPVVFDGSVGGGALSAGYRLLF